MQKLYLVALADKKDGPARGSKYGLNGPTTPTEPVPTTV